MTGKWGNTQTSGNAADIYDFSKESRQKDALILKIKQEYFTARRQLRQLTDDELESVNAAAREKPELPENEKK